MEAELFKIALEKCFYNTIEVDLFVFGGFVSNDEKGNRCTLIERRK